MEPPGELIASGRDSDIFDAGPGLVLRRSRRWYSMTQEARTMEYVRGYGYPVPAIEEVSSDGTDLVMERVHGPSMFAALSRRPWTIRRHAAMLADLHQRLHKIPAPDWLRPAPFDDGNEPDGHVLHLDLHPLNVIVTPKGPVVIDWPNAARGHGDSDVALTWLLMACAGLPNGRVKATVLGQGRGLLVRSFLRSFDTDAVRERLPGVVAWKVKDQNMTADEQRSMWDLARATGR